jgi:hypothetical protein
MKEQKTNFERKIPMTKGIVPDESGNYKNLVDTLVVTL